MRKIFLVAGELSGDKLGAWYVRRLRSSAEKDVEICAIGGDFLAQEGVALYDRIETLNIVGLVEVIKRLRFVLAFIGKLAAHIISHNFDEVVAIDFPGFNLRLIKKLKKLKPALKITYLSPPQVWIWGESRIRKIKSYCDEVIVLYPFEVEWYKSRGIETRWLGYPFYKSLQTYFESAKEKKKHIALIPGSRLIEIKRLLPLFLSVVRRFRLAHPDTKVFLPLAESIDQNIVEKIMRQAGLWGQDITIVRGEQEKLRVLSSCCLALTKPGTVSLELALLRVPAVVAYKAPWITYLIAKMLVNITHMSLPNLLLKDVLYSEFIQRDCKEEKMIRALEGLYDSWLKNDKAHQVLDKSFDALRKMLSG